MTKIWDIIYKEEPRGQSVTLNGIPCTARTCVTNLNRLTNENQMLEYYKDQSEKKQKHIVHLEGKIHRMRENIKRLEVLYHYRGQEGTFDVKEECWRLKQENGQLKKENKILKDKDYQLQKEVMYSRIYHEYDQLKRRHSLLHDECLELESERDWYQNEVKSLKKENKRLKIELGEKSDIPFLFGARMNKEDYEQLKKKLHKLIKEDYERFRKEGIQR